MKTLNSAHAGRISVYKYNDGRFKSESISLCFAMPASREESVKRSLLLSVLKRGTESYPTQQALNRRLDELYATLMGFKNQKNESFQLLGLSADLLKSRYTEGGCDILPDVLEVMGQIMLHPRLDPHSGGFLEEYVRSEKENYKSIILSQINEPRTYASIRCREEMFASVEPDRLDTMCERIDAVTAVELFECYRNIIESSGMVVFYVGEREACEVLDAVSAVFPSNGAPLKLRRAEPRLPTERDQSLEIEESADITQGRLVIGLNCGITQCDGEYFAMLLCNEILGSSPISKLMMNVREAMSLCYECSSVYNSARGAVFITTGIDPEDRALALGAIYEQIRALQNGEVSDTEMEAAKRSLVNAYSGITDSAGAIERFYLSRILNVSDTDINDLLERINGLELGDVVRAARRLSVHTVYFLGPTEAEHDE